MAEHFRKYPFYFYTAVKKDTDSLNKARGLFVPVATCFRMFYYVSDPGLTVVDE